MGRCYLIVAVAAVAMTSVPPMTFSLPFSDRWFVMQGGDTPNVNQHMAVRAQWYAIDFVKVGGPSGRELANGTPTKIDDFFSFGAKVVSPIDGEIVAAVDGLPDNPLGVKDPGNAAGNHVEIRTADDQFVFLAHLQRGTVSVKTGQHVRRGQLLGRCGNSGNSDFPHVHMHVQDAAAFNAGNGLNPIFANIDVELNGKAFSNVTWPLIRGLWVSNH